MKIYQVTAYDNAHSWFFFGTKKEAVRAAKTLRADYADSGYPNATIEIEAIDVEPTRTGIAAALQWFVDVSCINEH